MTLVKQKKHNTVIDAVGCNNYSGISERKLENELKDIPDNKLDKFIKQKLREKNNEWNKRI
jgi:hypothetical protein